MSGHPGERLSAFLDGELPAADRTSIEAHLRECAACARELEELAAVDAFARELPVEAPAGYFEDLPSRVRARVRRPARIPRLAVWAAAAAAAVMAIVVTPAVWHERSAVAPTGSAAQAVPPAPPATLAASMAPPSLDAFAPSGADQGGARLQRQARNEPRLLEREKEKADQPAKGMLGKERADSVSTRDRHDGLAVAPPAPAAAPPAPAGFEERAAATAAPSSTLAQKVELQAAAAEGARAEPEADAKQGRARPTERKLAAGNAGFAHPDDRALMTEKRYQGLLARPAASVAQARALRDAWELFARDFPADARADEARVRAIEAGVQAFQLGRDPADLENARARGRAYLAMENPPQAGRVRAALDALP